MSAESTVPDPYELVLADLRAKKIQIEQAIATIEAQLAATRDSEAGWSDRELEAKYGWRGGRMAEKYTDAANRQKLALGAAARTKPAAAPLESAARGGK